jgi:hypothetical protein
LIIINYRLKKLVLRINGFSVVFFLLILIPNIMLFARSGLVERYLLPTSIGLGYLFVSFIKGIEEKLGWFKKLASALIIISFIPFMVTSAADAIDFSKEGISTKKLLSAISSNYVNGSQVLVVVDPVQEYESSVSLKTYLFYEYNIDLFGCALVKNDDAINYPDYVGGWKSYFVDKQFENMTSKPGLLIFLNNKMIEKFFKSSDLVQTDYLKIEIGNSQFALLKEMQAHLVRKP